MKRWFRFFKFNFIPVFVLLISGAVQVFSDEKNPQQPSALDVWNQMVEQSFTQNPKPIAVAGTSGTITFGAEKEGSSGLITRIMGPQSSIFLQLLTRFNETPETHKQLFLVEFLSQFASGKSRTKTVTDSEGKSIPFELSDFKNIDYSKLSIEELEAKFKVWLERTGDQGFSFLKPSTRMQLFKGTFPGLSPNLNLDPKWNRSGINPVGNYAQWSPLYGPAQKYIDSAHNTGKGWEINFKKQNSYGEFEAMIDWFRKSLHNAGEDFEAPGHQRLVFPKRNLTPDQTQTQTKQLGELYKNIQAYIVLKGILGQTGIETSNHKSIIQDQSLTNDGHSSGRGVIRLENDRFKSNGLPTLSIELRSGTKSESTRRLVEQVVASRYAANDFSGLFFERNWVLIPSRQSLTAEDLVRRFGVSRLESQRALKALTERFHDGKTMPVDYLVPFWQWEQAPYLSLAKQEFIKDLTRAFIKKAASWENASQQTRQQALTSWIQASGLVDSLESYLIPSPPKTPVSKEAQNFHRARAELPHPVDVNKIDLGIEYTGRFPIKLSAVYDRDPSHPKASWIRTQYDLTPEERATLVRNLAELLGKKISGSLKPSITELSEGSHGHSFQLAFELKDAQGRKWRIEWDGVGRDYDSKGTVIEESIRGGHVEIVTPKFTPSAEDISAVFESMKSLGLQPDHRSGGGHINIDLAPFENNPKSMARFIAKFLEHRGIISLMFQDPRRVRTGEPNEVSPSLIQALKSFNGTEEQLKQLLYNERFFNTRLGRKTQYVQLNLNAYFQDIIPSQFLNKDFDLKNAPWRENFSVEPHIRKAEMRLFNAPQTTHEAQAQIQLVRSLLDSALNDKTSVSGEVQPVQHEHYAQNPERAKKDFEKLMHDLELDPNIYETYLWDGMQTTRSFLESDSYLPLEKALASFPKQTQWGTAVQARSQSEAINSEEREWNPNAISKASKELQDTRKNLRDLETIKRTELPPQPGELTRELPSLPLEFGLSGTQIESLSKPQQLAVYYLRSLSHLSSKAEKKHAQTKLREMKQLENFGEILSETLRTPVQAGKIEFPLWLAKLVKPQPPFHEAIAILLSSPRSEVRDIAIANLKKMSSKQVVEFLNNNQYQLPEVLQKSDAALTILDLINHLPRRLSERNRNIISLLVANALHHSSSQVQGKAFRLIGRFHNTQTSRNILYKLTQSSSNRLSDYYLKILSKMPSFATRQAISQTLQRNTGSPRANKLREILLGIDEQLVQLTPESFDTLETIDQLYSLFLKEKAGKPFPENKKIIKKLISKEGTEENFNHLLNQSLQSQNEELQEWLSQFFDRLSPEAHLLSHLIKSPNDTLRKRALDVLETLPPSNIQEVFNQWRNNTATPSKVNADILSSLFRLSRYRQEVLFNAYRHESSFGISSFLNESIKSILITSKDPYELNLAKKALFKFKSPLAFDLLRELLEKPDGPHVELALNVLMERNSPEASQIIRSVIKDHPNYRERLESFISKNSQFSKNLPWESFKNFSLSEKLRLLFERRHQQGTSEDMAALLANTDKWELQIAIQKEMNQYRQTHDPDYRKWLFDSTFEQFGSDASADLLASLLQDPIQEIRLKAKETLEKCPPHQRANVTMKLLEESQKSPGSFTETAVVELLKTPKVIEAISSSNYSADFAKALITVISQSNQPALVRYSFPILKQMKNEDLFPQLVRWVQSPNAHTTFPAKLLFRNMGENSLLKASFSPNFLPELEKLARILNTLPAAKALKEKLTQELEQLSETQIESLLNSSHVGISFAVEKLAPNSQLNERLKQFLLTKAGAVGLTQLFYSDFLQQPNPAVGRWILSKLERNPFVPKNEFLAFQMYVANPATQKKLLEAWDSLPQTDRLEIYQTLIGSIYGNLWMKPANNLPPAGLIERVARLPEEDQTKLLKDLPGELLVEWMVHSPKDSNTVAWVSLLTEHSYSPALAIQKAFANANPMLQRRMALALAKRAAQGDFESQSAIESLNLKTNDVYKGYFLPKSCASLLNQLN